MSDYVRLLEKLKESKVISQKIVDENIGENDDSITWWINTQIEKAIAELEEIVYEI